MLAYGGKACNTYKTSLKKEKPKQLNDAGYFIFSGRFKNGITFRVLFDAGPFGLEPTYAHAHADALSLLVDLDSKPFLIDSGTYNYHPKERKWRNYFRGTSAHNTVVVDQQDQAVPGGNMLWLSEPKTSLINCQELEEAIIIEAKHDGYCRLKDPVEHIRSIQINKALNNIVVKDSLLCKGKHKIDMYYHFYNDIHLQQVDKFKFIAYNGLVKVTITTSVAKKVSIKKGEPNLPLGWHSSKWNSKEPINVLHFEDEICGNYESKIIFSINAS